MRWWSTSHVGVIASNLFKLPSAPSAIFNLNIHFLLRSDVKQTKNRNSNRRQRPPDLEVVQIMVADKHMGDLLKRL